MMSDRISTGEQSSSEGEMAVGGRGGGGRGGALQIGGRNPLEKEELRLIYGLLEVTGGVEPAEEDKVAKVVPGKWAGHIHAWRLRLHTRLCLLRVRLHGMGMAEPRAVAASRLVNQLLATLKVERAGKDRSSTEHVGCWSSIFSFSSLRPDAKVINVTGSRRPGRNLTGSRGPGRNCTRP